jgi:hypothetical protein
MNITDPAAWPADLARLTLEHYCDGSLDTARLDFMVGARRVAELSALTEEDEVVLLQHEDENVFAGTGCWGVALEEGADGAGLSHLLFVAPESRAADGEITDELAAWGRLAVLWSTTAYSANLG